MDAYMEMAYKEAIRAYKKNEIPVGAVIVKNNKVIAKAYNLRQKKYDLLGHAEIRCILKAAKKLKDWRLDECQMFVTLEPCEMCMVHIKESRLKEVFFMSYQHKKTSKRTNVLKMNCYKELQEKYDELLKDFFRKMRK